MELLKRGGASETLSLKTTRINISGAALSMPWPRSWCLYAMPLWVRGARAFNNHRVSPRRAVAPHLLNCRVGGSDFFFFYKCDTSIVERLATAAVRVCTSDACMLRYTRYLVEMHHLFWPGAPHLRSSVPHPKSDSSKKRKKSIPMKNPIAQVYKNATTSQKQCWRSDDLGFRNPASQRTGQRQCAASIVKRT